MIEFEIDGKKVNANDGETIIEAADRVGIYIPRFCYHKNLSIAANCRMCLVEVEKAPKALPACATPVTPDMKVFTQSQKALQAQRIIMHFLLANHPLDCPICDQGGECELQDLAVGFGSPYSYYEEPKRAVYSEDIGPLIETEMTRCIHCTRCVRFGEEVAGLREMGVTGRGEHAEIGTYVKHFLKSELSGNIIDLCPVGALTAKPSRYDARGWELREHPLIAPHDCVGSNIFLHTRNHEHYNPEKDIMRVVPREHDQINETWISDRDRFSFQGIQSNDRSVKPLMKKNGRWIEVEWQRALIEISDRMKGTIQMKGADQIAALASSHCTVEEYYLLQKLMRGLGSNNIDHRLHQLDFSDQERQGAFPLFQNSIAELEEMQAVLLVGSHIRFEQPMLSNRINKAVQDGAEVFALNPVDYAFTYAIKEKIISADIIEYLLQIVRALKGETDNINEHAANMAARLQALSQSTVILGEFAINHPHAAVIRSLATHIAQLTQSTLNVTSMGCNSAGAWLAGAIPHRKELGHPCEKEGLTAKACLTDQPVSTYLLLNVEPESDCAYPSEALKALENAGFVVCISPYATETMKSYADFILPAAPFVTSPGTYINIEGQWQSYAACGVPSGESKPAWKILRALGSFLAVDGMEYQTAHQVREQLQLSMENMPELVESTVDLPSTINKVEAWTRLANWSPYHTDSMMRRAHALHEVGLHHPAAVVMNQASASELQVEEGDKVRVHQLGHDLTLPVHIDNTVADKIVSIAAGLPETAGFGRAMDKVTLERVTT